MDARTRILMGRVQDLPYELRSMIWEQVITSAQCYHSAIRHTAHFELEKLSRDRQTKLLYHELGTRVRYAEVSRYGGHCWIFNLPMRHNSLAFQDFVQAVRRLVVFEFMSFTGIRDFVRRMQHCLPVACPFPAIRVGIRLFSEQVSTFRDWPRLDLWRNERFAHGEFHEAALHVAMWMQGARALPPQVAVQVTLYHPWRNYHSLRYLTRLIRTGRETLDVFLDARRWNTYPDMELHLGLTVDAIQGTNQAQALTFTPEEARELYRKGCRGFRG